MCTKLGHRCEKKGCGSALVMDGNMKNHRHVCLATNAGYTEYKGLQGKVQTGCPNTPAYKSPYCKLHKPLISTQNVEHDDGASESKPVGLIIAKKETRKTTLYQVRLRF